MPLFAHLCAVAVGAPSSRQATSLAAAPADTLCSKVEGGVLALDEGRECRLPWEELRPLLRPTQPSVGYAWVLNIKQRNFANSKMAQASLDEETIPVAAGLGVHGDALYLVDHHHLLSALDLSGHNPLVRVHMACRLKQSSEVAIWNELFHRGWAFPHSIPAIAASNFTQRLTLSEALAAVPRQLRFTPTNQTLVDDPWRSLAGFARKLDASQLAPPDGGSCPAASKFCMRAYDSPCRKADNSAIPFLEFRWAHFFARAYQERQLWPSKGECRSCSATPAVDFSRSFVALPETRLGKAKDVDMAPWFEAAAQLVPLARGKAAAEYSLPDEFGPHAGNLPGVLNGMHAVAHPEPECNPIDCTKALPALASATASAQS